MQNEIWKDIAGFDGVYQISNLGRVKSLDRVINIEYKDRIGTRRIKGRLRKPTKDKDGYLVIGLGKGNYKIHRLVALAFIHNTNNYPQINHKDGNKSNNTVTNLEWCSNAENQNHAFKIGLKKTKQFAKVDLISDKVIRIYHSLQDVMNDIDKIDPSTLVKVCKGKRNEHCGYKWLYADGNMKVGDVVVDRTSSTR